LRVARGRMRRGRTSGAVGGCAGVRYDVCDYCGYAVRKMERV